jgi:hypothetical protein
MKVKLSEHSTVETGHSQISSDLGGEVAVLDLDAGYTTA